MTRDSAKDDRALNERIAVEVMQLDEVENVSGVLYFHNVEMDRTSETGGRWRSPVPNYAGEFAAAMQVVEKMRERGFDVCMRHSEWTDGKRRWLVEFDAGGVGYDATYRNADGDSLPRAICLAAINALEENNGVQV